MNIELLRNQLSGPSFRRLMVEKKTNKYRVAKGTGISYRTLCFWQNGAIPSEKNALLVGEFLGLMKSKNELDELEKQAKKMLDRIAELKGEPRASE